MYYDYFLNIDVSVYEHPPQKKGQIDVMAVRLDVIKRILAIMKFDGELFYQIDPNLEDIIDMYAILD